MYMLSKLDAEKMAASQQTQTAHEQATRIRVTGVACDLTRRSKELSFFLSLSSSSFFVLKVDFNNIDLQSSCSWFRLADRSASAFEATLL
jgi:hypothetical protein